MDHLLGIQCTIYSESSDAGQMLELHHTKTHTYQQLRLFTGLF